MRLKTEYNSLQIALNKRVSHGFLLKGAYTLSKAMNESERRRPGHADVQHAERARSQLGAGRLRPAAQLPVGLRVSAAVAEHRNGYANAAQAIVRGLAVERRLRRVQRQSVHDDGAAARSVNTPSNQQTADLTGTYNITDKIGSAGAWFDTTAFAQPTGVRFGNTGRNQFYGPGGWNLDLRCSAVVPDGWPEAARGPDRRPATSSTSRSSPTRRATSRPARSDRSPASRADGALTNAAYTERSVVLGLRFTF